METIRREQHTDVINTSVTSDQAAYTGLPPVDLDPTGPARTTAHQTETVTSDPYAPRREGTLRGQNAINWLFGILEGLLGIRFVLGLFGANPAAGFTQFILSVTQPFLTPFVGLFRVPRSGGGVFDVSLLVAILVYALLAWVLVKALGLVAGDSRRGVRTTTSQIDTHVR